MTADFLSFFSPKIIIESLKSNCPLLGPDPLVEHHRSKWMLLLPLWIEIVVALIQIPLFSSEVLVTHQISCLLLLLVNQFERRSPGARLARVRSCCLQRRYYLSHRQTVFFFLPAAGSKWCVRSSSDAPVCVPVTLALLCGYTGY